MRVKSKKRRIKYDRNLKNRKWIMVTIACCVPVIFIIFIGRFSYVTLGTVNNVNLNKRTEKKYDEYKNVPAKRGSILDRNGETIAEDSHRYSLYAVLDKNYYSLDHKPLFVVDPKKTADELAKYIPLSSDKIYKALTQKAYQVEFGNAGNNLTLETKKKIESAKIQGIFFNELPSRMYPNGTFASHIVGFTTFEKSDSIGEGDISFGQMGIEKYYNRTLSGQNGLERVRNDFYGYSLESNPQVIKKTSDGAEIKLTLDTNLQNYLESLMSDVYDKYQPDDMKGTLVDAKTGEILAAAQRPTFDLQTKDNINGQWRDTLVEDGYEPGSTMKIFSIASAIEHGKYNPNGAYKSGTITVPGGVIHDWNPLGWGVISFHEGFIRSSNVAMVNLQNKVGQKTWYEDLKKFGFGKKTGIQLPGEVSGSIQYEQPMDKLITSFGQGINVTTMQLVQALTAISNDGKMLQPSIVKEIDYPNGTKKVTGQKVVSEPIKASTAKMVRDEMVDVVENPKGLAQPYKIPGVKIAAKTGTAEIASAGSGGYQAGDGSNYVYSVAGMAPADDPEFIIYISMKKPHKADKPADQIIASIFKPLMQKALASKKNNSVNQKDISFKMPNLVGQTRQQAEKVASDKKFKIKVLGNGNVITKQGLKPDDDVLIGDTIFVATDDGTTIVPNFTGMSEKDVKQITSMLDLDTTNEGTGFVKSQSIAPGTKISSKQKINIKYE